MLGQSVSMVLPEVAQRFDAGGEWNGRDQVIICGIESHVCVMQTALDLAERGCEVHVVVDGVSSQRSEDSEQYEAMMRSCASWADHHWYGGS